MSDCIFCDIVAGEAPASFVYRDELVSAFLDNGVKGRLAHSELMLRPEQLEGGGSCRR